MNYSIFYIESLLSELHKTLKDTGFIQNGYNNLECQLRSENRNIFDAVVKKLLSFRDTCREVLKVQKIENSKFQSDLDITAFILPPPVIIPVMALLF
jgi:hypothetical protein